MANYYFKARRYDDFNYDELFETLFRKYDIRRTTINVSRDNFIIETSNFRSFVDVINMFENEFPNTEYVMRKKNEEEEES